MLFARHVESLSQFLDRRQDIIERIERDLLNVRDKEVSRIRDYKLFDQRLTSCFFEAPGRARDSMRENGQLAAAHVADGFEPVQLDGYAAEFNPLQLILQAYRPLGAREMAGEERPAVLRSDDLCGRSSSGRA